MPFGALLVGGMGLRRLLNTWTTGNKSRAEFSDNQIDDISNADKDKPSDISSSKFSRDLQDELDRLET